MFKCKVVVLCLLVAGFSQRGFAHVIHISTDKQKEVINVKSFGAVGDGKTDDYKALLAVVNLVNQKGGGSVFFPKGTYFIGQYHTKNNKVSDLQFSNCNGLTIRGEGAIILVNGNFKRTVDYSVGGGRHTYSKTSAIMPLLLNNCSNVLIENLELNGGVAQMTRDSGTAETGGHLLRIIECTNVIVRNLHLHHAQTDGIAISGKNAPSSNVKMYNVISENNARVGMAIGNLVGAEFVNCKFRESGRTGSYGGHAPCSGVDIEPEKLAAGRKTSGIRFSNCVFENNLGGQFLCSSPALTTDVSLVRCTIKAVDSRSNNQMVLSADKVLVDSCDIDCGGGNVYPRWQKSFGSDVEIRNSTIRSSSSGIMAMTDSDKDHVNIHDNKIICTSTGPIRSYFPYLRMKNLSFVNNDVFIKTTSLRPAGVTSLIEGGNVATGNKFHTESGSQKPKISYKGMLKVNN